MKKTKSFTSPVDSNFLTRRAFLVRAAVSATFLSGVTGATAVSAATESNLEKGEIPMANLTGRLDIQLQREVTKEQISGVLEHIYRLSGCSTCGIRGIDVRLVGGGDPEVGPIAKLPGVGGAILAR